MQPTNAIQAWQLLLVALARWINRHQLDVIAYIQEENKILTSKLKDRRIRFSDDELCASQPRASSLAVKHFEN